jgi:hypothetical protein
MWGLKILVLALLFRCQKETRLGEALSRTIDSLHLFDPHEATIHSDLLELCRKTIITLELFRMEYGNILSPKAPLRRHRTDLQRSEALRHGIIQSCYECLCDIRTYAALKKIHSRSGGREFSNTEVLEIRASFNMKRDALQDAIFLLLEHLERSPRESRFGAGSRAHSCDMLREPFWERRPASTEKAELYFDREGYIEMRDTILDVLELWRKLFLERMDPDLLFPEVIVNSHFRHLTLLQQARCRLPI